MKITRRQLIKLIKETTIKPGIPDLDTDSYEKALTLARHSEPEVRQQADDLAGAMGYGGSFSGDIDEYDNPVTRETVVVVDPEAIEQGTEKSSREKEVVIPRYLVDNIINLHQGVLQGDPIAEMDFSNFARKIFNHIDRDVQPDYVYAYGLKIRGYRAKEYNDAMNAVGEYL